VDKFRPVPPSRRCSARGTALRSQVGRPRKDESSVRSASRASSRQDAASPNKRGLAVEFVEADANADLFQIAQHPRDPSPDAEVFASSSVGGDDLRAQDLESWMWRIAGPGRAVGFPNRNDAPGRATLIISARITWGLLTLSSSAREHP
jgi:hypothetical protein